MKKIKLLVTSLLLALPFLMANSPAPYPFPKTYTEFTHTAITETHDGVANNYIYTTTITNTGDGYLSINDISLLDGEEFASLLELYDGLFIRKSETFELTFKNRAKVNDPKLRVLALTNPKEGVSVTNIRNITKSTTTRKTGSGAPVYLYKYEADITGISESRYSQAIATYTYGGKTITAGIYSGNDRAFYSDVDMDVANIEIQSIAFFEGPQRTASTIIGTLVNFFVIGFIGLLFIILIPIIIIVVIVVRKNKKQAV